MKQSGEYVKNSNLENALITLSAGKLTFHDIFNMIKANSTFITDGGNLFDECLSIYKEFERELSVIWKKI